MERTYKIVGVPLRSKTKVSRIVIVDLAEQTVARKGQEPWEYKFSLTSKDCFGAYRDIDCKICQGCTVNFECGGVCKARQMQYRSERMKAQNG